MTRVLNKTASIIGPVPLLFVSLCTAFAGQYYIYFNKQPLEGVLCFIAAALLLRLADFSADNTEDVFSERVNEDARRVSKKKEAVLFIIIVAVGVFFRFYAIDTIPPGSHRDEGRAGYDAFCIMQDEPLMDAPAFPVYTKSLTDNPAAFNYMIAAVYKAIKPGITQARIATAFIGLAAVIALYFLLRGLFGVYTAFFITVIFAALKWPVIYSRLVYHAALMVPLLIIAVYYAVRAVRYGKWGDYIVLGFSAGFVLHTYQAARMAPLAIAAGFLAVSAVKRGFFRKNYLKMGAAFLIFCIAAAPLIMYAVDEKNEFLSRARGHFIFSQEHVEKYEHLLNKEKPYWEMYAKAAKSHFFIFNLTGDHSGLHNTNRKPMFDFVAGAFAFLGIFYCLLRLNSPLAVFFLILFAAGIHGGILFSFKPQATRSIGAMPLAVIMAGCAVYRFYSIAFAVKPPGKNIVLKTFIFLTACAAVFSVYENYKYYFVEYKTSNYKYQAFDAHKKMAAVHLKKLGREWHGYMAPAFMHGGAQITTEVDLELAYENMKAGSRNYSRFVAGITFPVDPGIDKNVVFLLTEDYSPFVPVFKKVYPKGRYIPYYINNIEKPQFLLFFAFEIDKEHIAERASYKLENGLKAEYFAAMPRGGGRRFILETIQPFIYMDYANTSPIGKRPFTAVFSGKIKAPATGMYLFEIASYREYSLEIDGRKVLENKTGSISGTKRRTIHLTEGQHNIKLTYHGRGDNWLNLKWRRPGQSELEGIASEFLLPQ
ncbi:MAG: glycosyltransferase family 39 protein [Candidatus Goldiibacteriota bacterium]